MYFLFLLASLSCLPVCDVAQPVLKAGKLIQRKAIPVYPFGRYPTLHVGDTIFVPSLFHQQQELAIVTFLGQLQDTNHVIGLHAIIRDSDEIVIGDSDLPEKRGWPSLNILRMASARWLGKYLWTNIGKVRRFPFSLSSKDDTVLHLPAFSRVKVIGISVRPETISPYTFRLKSDRGDTLSISVRLNGDSSALQIFSYAFGDEFLESPPSNYWISVPTKTEEFFGLRWGTDSNKVIHQLHIREHAISKVALTDSQLVLWTCNIANGKTKFDSVGFNFWHGILSGVAMKSLSKKNFLSRLKQTLGVPTRQKNILGTRQYSWLFYEPGTLGRSIVFVDSKNEGLLLETDLDVGESSRGLFE